MVPSQYTDLPAVGSASWRSPVADAASLPTSGNRDGDARVTLNDQSIYVWKDSTMSWLQAATPAATSAITALNTDVSAVGPGAVPATIQPNVVSNSKLAQMPANTIKANATGVAADPQDVSLSSILAPYVLKAGDTMTGTLVSPKISFNNTLDSATLDIAWSTLNNRYEVTNPTYGLNITTPAGQLFSVTSGSSYFEMNGTAVNAYSDGGGIILADISNGAFVEVSGGGSVNLQTGNSSDFNVIANNSVFSYFNASGSGDYTVQNTSIGSNVFSALSSGRTSIQSSNGEGVWLVNSPGTNAKTVVNNGFDITDDNSISQAFLLAYEGGNLAFGRLLFGGGLSSSPSNNIGIGTECFAAGVDGALSNTAIGQGVMSQNSVQSAAISNIGIGDSALAYLSTGSSNLAVGKDALFNLTSASDSIAIGNEALFGVITNSGNVAIGPAAGKSLSGSGAVNNIFLGASAGVNTVNGSSNTFLGISSGANIDGSINIAIGGGCMTGAAGATATGNIAIGGNQLPSISTGDYNVVIGFGGGASGVITSGSKNIILGYQSDVPSGTASNQMSIGNAIYGLDISSGTGSTVSTAAKIGIGEKAPQASLHITQATAGNEVFRIETTASGSDPSERVLQNRVTTTNATPTTLHTFTTPGSTTYVVEANVTARRTGGSAGTAEDGAFYKLIATFKNVAGTATQIGTTTVVATNESQAGWDAAFSVSGATAILSVTGATNNNVTWHVTARTYQVGN